MNAINPHKIHKRNDLDWVWLILVQVKLNLILIMFTQNINKISTRFYKDSQRKNIE